MLTKLRRVLHGLTFVAAMLAAGPSSAHFQNFLGRIIHVESADGGTRLYARLPLAAVLLPGDWQPGDAVSYSRKPSGSDRPDALLLDTAALESDPGLLQERLRGALLLDPSVPPTTIEAIRIEPIGERSPFSHLAQIRDQLNQPLLLPKAPLPLADAVVDFSVFYPDLALDDIDTLSSNPREWHDIAARTINILTLYHADGSRRLTSQGPLHAVLQSEDTGVSLLTQIRSGYHHVLIGLDHLLFMLILMLAARHWRRFLRTSLAFTLGHSVTLGLCAAGWLSAPAWFVPLVETAIALTIVYSGACLLLGRGDRLLAGRVFAIGLLHGLGFAFVLQQASGSAPGDLLQVWFGFNFGIELGQLSVYLTAAPLLWLLKRYWPPVRLQPQAVLALPCLLVASVWTLQRGLDLAGAVGFVAT
ncbi:MAG: HupE/UreJ family protein [Oceanospirillaceae bacterium]|nr:HupE/UreJ family protein [Oceanospirillaceae bacterium]